MAKAASAAFLLLLLASCGPSLAQQANEPEREMIAAAERGELVVVKKLLAGGARIDARDQRGRTALLAATHRNRVEVARFLIQEGADVNAKDFIQDSPYLYAAAEGRIEILKMTLAAGADLKDTNRYRGTGLIPAAHHGHVEAVKLLLATAIDKDHVNNLGWTALLEAVILGDGGAAHTEIVRLLVEAGANVNIADRDGVTPLAHAKKSGYSGDGPHPVRRRRALTDRPRCGGQGGRRRLALSHSRDRIAADSIPSGEGISMIRLMLGFVAAVDRDRRAANAQSAVERGSYLVNTIMTCANCHSPKGPPAAVAGKDFSGGLRFDEPPFDVTAPNITPDKDTGIGNWTDAQIKTMMHDRQGPNGMQVAPRSCRRRSIRSSRPAISNAIVAYLRSLTPVKNKVADPVYKIALPHHVFPGAEKSYTQADLNDKVKRGFYLVTIGHCMECHTPLVDRRPADFDNSLGKGGREFPGPWGVSKSRNITSHKTAGIGDWTDAEIKTAITQGKRKDGTPLKGPMGYPYYAKMTDADLDAVIAYLRTVPPKE